MTDPRRVAAVIGEVVDDLQRWKNAAANAVEEADAIQRQTTEAVTTAGRLGALAAHHASEHRAAAERIRASADEAADAGALAVAAAEFRSRSAGHTNAFAQRVATGWEHELAAARDWEARAQQRVRAAEAWVQRARANVASAERNLSRAEAALRSCQRDPNRRSCQSEANAVNRAIAVLEAAREDLRHAQHELQLAREELARAQRRVSGCERAVGFAHRAAGLAARALAEADEARHMGALARDHGNDAVSRALGAAAANRRELEAAAEAARAAARAGEELTEATNELVRVDAAYERARRLAFDGSAEMRTAIRHLRDFDRGALA